MNDTNNFTGFYKLSQNERRQKLADDVGLNQEDLLALEVGLSAEQAELMIENVVGQYALPLGIATHFLINGSEVLVPMVIEEPSVVAGVSYAAKLARLGGGFLTHSSEPIMIGQLQLLDVPDLDEAMNKLKAIEPDLLKLAQQDPIMQRLGGGPRSFEYRPFPNTPAGPMLIVHLLYDCRDAMGANTVNTAVEAIAPLVAQTTGGRVNLRILSNLADQRMAHAECLIVADQLARDGQTGEQIAKAVFEAWAFAAVDPYRTATHNKGIMNGIDAVAIATGNDWRAIEAGAHAYAARNGQYSSLTQWSLAMAPVMNETETRMESKLQLRGTLSLPMAVGTVGGATKSHPTARTALKILGQPDARQLAEIMVAVGLAQNLAALRALTTEGIQQGHMRLHARKNTK